MSRDRNKYYSSSNSDIVHSALMSPGARIAAERESRGMKQYKLARAAGISQASLSQLESGESKQPRGETLMRVCRVLRLNPEWVLFGKGEKTLDYEMLERFAALSEKDRMIVLDLMKRLNQQTDINMESKEITG